jgi:outer membrane protein assembly factor BamB
MSLVSPQESPRADSAEANLRAWRMTAWMAGVFTALVGAAMLFGYGATRMDDPLNSRPLKQYKEKLRLNPADESLKQHIRQLDLQLRQKYFRHISQIGSGVYLLFGGVFVLVLAMTQSRRNQKQLPALEPRLDSAELAARAAAKARWAVGACGTAIGVLLFILSLGISSALPKRADEAEKLLAAPPAAAAEGASPAEFKKNWPRFRGPDGSGFAVCANAPSSWDIKSGSGVAWKVPAPVLGFNSPIVWENRIFFSGGDARKREVICLEATSGQTLWRQPLTVVPASPAVEIPESSGYAAPTMATDGRRVYVIFANGDLGAFTLDGKPVWSKSFGPLKNAYGYAASLAIWRERLIVQLDQGESEEGRSKLYAFDGATGQVAWQRPRKVPSSWASPIVIEAAGKSQIITLSIPWVIAYAATDGTELWRVECLNGEVTPSPIYVAGLVIIPSPSEKLLAIRPDGVGDVTKTHVAWTSEENVPDVTSPTSNGELIFTVTSSGVVTCLDAKDGKKQWEHDYETEFHASPSVAANRLYLFSQKGTAVVLDAARQFKELFRTEMADGFHASPAFVEGRIFLRGETNVWGLADSPIHGH